MTMVAVWPLYLVLLQSSFSWCCCSHHFSGVVMVAIGGVVTVVIGDAAAIAIGGSATVVIGDSATF